MNLELKLCGQYSRFAPYLSPLWVISAMHRKQATLPTPLCFRYQLKDVISVTPWNNVKPKLVCSKVLHILANSQGYYLQTCGILFKWKELRLMHWSVIFTSLGALYRTFSNTVELSLLWTLEKYKEDGKGAFPGASCAKTTSKIRQIELPLMGGSYSVSGCAQSI